MIAHEEATNHEISLSFSDLSLWCYECDSYITHRSFGNLIDVLHRKKFSEPLPPRISEGLRAIGFQVSTTTTAPPVVEGTQTRIEKQEEDEKEDVVEEPLEEEPPEKEEEPEEGGEEISLTEVKELLESLKIKDTTKIVPALSALTIEAVANGIKAGKFTNIIVMSGAGISVSAGIPDFRTPGTGLYDNLQKYNLPYPEAIFEISYFKKNPKPFFLLAKELYPGNFAPTPTHYFVKLLEKKRSSFTVLYTEY